MTSTKLRVLAYFIFLSQLSLGCTGNHFIKEGKSISPVPHKQQTGTLDEYRLGFGDVIEIKFFRNPEFNDTITVRPDGRISLMKIGELKVAGMTPAALDSVITQTYAEFVLEPDVTVIVREFGGYQVYILGAVDSPGGYPIQRDMSVLHAIASAGGATNAAKLNSVMVLRRGQTKEIVAYKVDVLKPFDAKNVSEVIQNDLIIEPYDIVYVPKTAIANIATFMTHVYDGFLPPLNFYVRALIAFDVLNRK